jgi:hypothetical protein
VAEAWIRRRDLVKSRLAIYVLEEADADMPPSDQRVMAYALGRAAAPTSSVSCGRRGSTRSGEDPCPGRAAP